MKKVILTGVLAVFVISMFVACTATAVDKEQIQKEIQAKEDEFAKVFNSGELKNIGYYADDAITYYQNKAPLVGKKAILDFLQSDLDSNTNIISFKTKEVFPSSDGNQVVEIGYFELMDSANIIINTGNYMALFEKRNGAYVSVRDMSVSNVPIR